MSKSLGTTYEGDWAHGKREGFGVVSFLAKVVVLLRLVCYIFGSLHCRFPVFKLCSMLVLVYLIVSVSAVHHLALHVPSEYAS